MHSPLFAWFFFKGFSMGAMVARAFQSRANMWQLVKKLLNYFYLTNLWAKLWLLCVFFLCYKVASYKVVVAFNFGGNRMLLQVNRMVKTLKVE
jgi:hypothetical protein